MLNAPKLFHYPADRLKLACSIFLKTKCYIVSGTAIPFSLSTCPSKKRLPLLLLKHFHTKAISITSQAKAKASDKCIGCFMLAKLLPLTVMLQANYRLTSILLPFMALLKCMPLLYFSLLSWPDELHHKIYTGEYYASPSRRTGVCGGSLRGIRRARTTGMAGLLLPPAKNIGRT
jgi:hypothetical protein